jgi:CubicO group peptidase (beta-lactamase class C family)
LTGFERTRARLESGRERGLHSGALVYVSRGGQSLLDLAWGEMRPGEPMREDALALWLSSTKPVAAIAVAQLWEQGALGLDDAVARHLPEFAGGGKDRVTIRHLLTHTAGIRMLDVGWPQKSWEEIIAGICATRLEPRWVPGEKAGYHLQSSWFALAEIVRRIDGRPFERYARAAVFEPLGMTDCWVGMPAERFRADRARLAPMYDTETTPPRDLGWVAERGLTTCAPGANGCGPMRELGRLYEALLAGGERAGARILRPQTVEALVSRQRTGLVDQTFRKVMDWGLGFIPNPAIYGDPDVPYAYGRHASRRAYGHSGRRSSTAFADPEHGLVVALMVNGLPGDAEHAQRFRAILEAIYEDAELAGSPLPPGEG